MKFDGVFAATVTPFDGTGKLDSGALIRHLQWLACSGVSGFVPCGTTGEAPTLTDGEREEIISLTVAEAHGADLKVIAGCGSNSTEISRRQILDAHRLGCDGALVVTPFYNRPTQLGLIAHYSALADASALPIVLYNVPSRTGVNLTPETVQSLLLHPNILGIKEASGSYSQWLDLARRIDWRERTWFAGDDDAVAVTLALGGRGVISATANLIPERFVALYESAKSGNLQQAFEIQRAIQGVVRAAFVETNPSPIKTALHLMGRMSEQVRLPLVSPTTQSKEIIRNALSAEGLV